MIHILKNISPPGNGFQSLLKESIKNLKIVQSEFVTDDLILGIPTRNSLILPNKFLSSVADGDCIVFYGVDKCNPEQRTIIKKFIDCLEKDIVRSVIIVFHFFEKEVEI